MAVPSDYAEARDPRTAGPRLAQLAQEHPELQALVALNPGCPPELHQQILRTNPGVQRVLEERAARDAPGAAAGQPPTEVLSAAPAAGASWGVDHAPSSQPVPGPQPVPARPAGMPPREADPATGPLPADMFEEAAPAAERRGSRTALWVLGACLILLVPLVLGGVVLGRAMLGDRSSIGPETTAAGPATSKAAPSGAAPSSAETTTSAAPSTQDVASPAPEGAADLPNIVSPSDNIACTLAGDSVGCSVATRSYAESGKEDCPAGAPFSIRADGAGAALACGTVFGTGDMPALAYGRSAKHGDVACTSESSGMTCWNVKSGHGFRVNKSEYETF